MRVSDYITQFFVGKGIDTVYMLSGGGMMHLIDAVGKCKELDYVCNHHEQASVMAADGYARKTGKIGVCYLTSGPGGVNGMTGVLGAWLDSVPVFCISGQSKLKQTIRDAKITGLRQFGTFESDIIEMIKPITKYQGFVDDPNEIKFHLEKAYHYATSGRPGPIWLDIPIDIQGAKIDETKLRSFYFDSMTDDLDESDESKLHILIEELYKAKRPVILAGHGVKAANLVVEFKKLISDLDIPVLTTPLAVDLLEYDDPKFIGHPSVKGDRAGNFAIQNCDFILSFGNSYHVMTTGYEINDFAPNAYKTLIDVDQFVIQRQEIKIDLAINVDTRKAISFIKENIDVNKLSVLKVWKKYCYFLKTEFKNEIGRNDTLNYYSVVECLNTNMPVNSSLVTDSGSAFYVVGQTFKSSGQMVINSGGLGCMGFSLPASIGVAMGDKSAPVVCFTGDGSIQVNIQELATVKHNSLNVKIIVINNGGYVSIRNSQENYFSSNYVGSNEESGVWLPKLELIANSYEIKYSSCKNLSDLDFEINKLFESNEPMILEIFAPNELEIMPTVSSIKLEDGTMRSKPIHDMFPFLSENSLSLYMFDKFNEN